MQLRAAPLPANSTVLFGYRAMAALQNPITQSGAFQTQQPGPDLQNPGPDGATLFEVEFGLNSFTITATRSFTDPLGLEFEWTFSLPPGADWPLAARCWSRAHSFRTRRLASRSSRQSLSIL